MNITVLRIAHEIGSRFELFREIRSIPETNREFISCPFLRNEAKMGIIMVLVVARFKPEVILSAR